MHSAAVASYTLLEGSLLKDRATVALPPGPIDRAVVGLPGGRYNLRSYIGAPRSLVGLSELFRWVDGLDIFDVSTAKLRAIQAGKVDVAAHPAFSRWEEQLQLHPDLRKIWQDTWLSCRAVANYI